MAAPSLAVPSSAPVRLAGFALRSPVKHRLFSVCYPLWMRPAIQEEQDEEEDDSVAQKLRLEYVPPKTRSQDEDSDSGPSMEIRSWSP
ncbi:MAG: hypothetical protein M1814_006424 [Vezdaea aestivalis]|nr:MAG: hypothetical protein M1814_006424 [Vezdaea aestivalis]